MTTDTNSVDGAEQFADEKDSQGYSVLNSQLAFQVNVLMMLGLIMAHLSGYASLGIMGAIAGYGAALVAGFIIIYHVYTSLF